MAQLVLPVSRVCKVTPVSPVLPAPPVIPVCKVHKASRVRSVPPVLWGLSENSDLQELRVRSDQSAPQGRSVLKDLTLVPVSITPPLESMPVSRTAEDRPIPRWGREPCRAMSLAVATSPSVSMPARQSSETTTSRLVIQDFRSTTTRFASEIRWSTPRLISVAM